MTTNQTKHTALPWSYQKQIKFIVDEQGDGIAKIHRRAGKPIKGGMYGRTTWADNESEANAAFIVRVVNSHDALVSALARLEEGVRLWMTKPVEPCDLEAARAALKIEP